MERLVVMGTSLGGLTALETILAGLPAAFPAAIAMVQHRSTESGRGLLTVLQRHSALTIKEPQDKEEIVPGRIYLAPADYHLLIEDGHFSLSTGAPVSYARPSVDVLFESAADAYGRNTIAVVLTGANHDGAYGARMVKEAGGDLIVQDPETAESPVMPRATIAAVKPDEVLPLGRIASALVSRLMPNTGAAPIGGPT